MLWKKQCSQSMKELNNTMHDDAECNSYTGHDLDKELSDAIDDNIDSIVPWFVMATYAKEIEDDPIISAPAYERTVKRIAEHWEEINHPYKDNLTLDKIGHSVYINEYPARVKGGVDQLRGAYKIGAKYRK